MKTVQPKLCSPILPDVIASPNTEEFGEIFSLHEIFFSPTACAGIFFFRVNPSALIFFSDKYCFFFEQ